MMLERHDKFWTAERVEFVREWRERGATAADIAVALGTTKNAVVGKCRREDIPSGRSERPTPPVFRSMITLPSLDLIRAIEGEIAAWERDSGERKIPTSILDRKSDQCAAILDQRSSGGHAMMCGEPTVLGLDGTPSSWCAAHHEVYHRKDDYGQTGFYNERLRPPNRQRPPRED
jgi:hypothetical protein